MYAEIEIRTADSLKRIIKRRHSWSFRGNDAQVTGGGLSDIVKKRGYTVERERV
jgi:hypothetical protein